MRSKETYDLPPEIWDHIISDATYFKGEFDLQEWVKGEINVDIDANRDNAGNNGSGRDDDDDNFERNNLSDSNWDLDLELVLGRRDIFSNTESNKFILRYRADFKEQLRLRQDLVLVCRQWYALAIRHLYGSLVVSDEKIASARDTITLDQPYQTSTLHSSSDPNHLDHSVKIQSQSFGAFVRRIEVGGTEPLGRRKDLIQLISHCPNLIIFYESIVPITTFGRPLDPSLPPSYAVGRLQSVLTESHPNAHHFRHIAGSIFTQTIASHRFVREISSFSSLVALQFPVIFPIPETETSRIPVSLPKLRFLDIGSRIDRLEQTLFFVLAGWDMPSLSTVWLSTGHLSWYSSLSAFWRKYGPQLTTIKIYGSSNLANPQRLGPSSSPTKLGIDLAASSMFPNLRQLILKVDSDDVTSFLPNDSLRIYEIPFPSQYREDIWPPLDSLLWDNHLCAFGSAKLYAPNLRLVRISHCPKPGSTDRTRRALYEKLMNKRLKSWRAYFGKRGITFETLEED